MRGELKMLTIWEETDENGVYIPDDPEYFGATLQAFIGCEGDSRGDSFDVMVCSPRWLVDNFNYPNLAERWYETPNLHFGRRLILMERWDYAELWSCIQSMCVDFEGPDWDTVANRIGRWLPWEFQHHVDDALVRAGGVPKTDEDNA